MTEQTTAKLDGLQKYIPFMDYYIASGFEKSEKFDMMRNLLISKRRQPLHILEKIESSINMRYKNLPEDVVVPEYIHQIFRIDLCSDDDDDNHGSYKKKDEDVMFVSIIHPDPNMAHTKQGPSTSQYKRNFPNKVEKIDLEEDVIISSVNVANEKIVKSEDLPTTPDIIITCDDVANDKKCVKSEDLPRTPDVIITCDDVDNDKSPKILDLPRAHDKLSSSSISMELIILDSSSDEELPSKKMSERVQSNEKNSTVSSSCKAVHSKESVKSGSVLSTDLNHNAESLENLDYDQVQELFLQCLQNTPNMDRETFEKSLISVIAEAGFEDATHENDAVNPNLTDNLQANTGNGMKTSHQQENTTSFMQQQNVAYHSPPTVPPNIQNIYKRINLNDPRIIKRIAQESLQYGQYPKPSLTACVPVSNPVPTTYGEHRRAKEMEAKRREEEKQRVKEDIKRCEEKLKREREEQMKRRLEEANKQRREEEEKRRQGDEHKRRKEEEIQRRQDEENNRRLHRLTLEKKEDAHRRKEIERHEVEVNRRKNVVKRNANPKESLMSELQPYITPLIDAIAEDKNKSTANENLQKKKVERELKGLECTVKGYTSLQDFIPRTLSGKRRSSVSARVAIAEQLRSRPATTLSENDDSEDNFECQSPPKNKKSEVSARTKSPIPKDNHMDCAPEPEANRKLELSKLTLGPLLRKRMSSTSEPSILSKPSENDSIDLDFERPSKYSKISTTSEENLLLQNHKPHSSKESNANKVDIYYQTGSQELLKVRSASLCKDKLPDCYVMLRKLSMDEIEKMGRPNSKCASRTKPPPERKKTKLKTNTDRNMFESNTRFCVLCKVRPADLTNHYIRTHKTESYVARLSSQKLSELQEKVRFATEIPSSSRLKKFKVECGICNEELIDTFLNFYNHFSAHTGEYAFQCAGCQLLKPFRADIQSHQCHAKTCRNSSIRLQYQYHKNIMTIHLYCCRICNFMQLNQENVFKHLREQHEKPQKDATFVEQLILCAMADDSAEDRQSSEFPEVDDIPVCNEPLVESYNDEVLTKIKTEIHEPSIVPEFYLPMTTIPTTLITEGRYDVFEDPNVDDSGVVDLNLLVAKPKRLKPNGKNTPHLVYKMYPENIECLGLFKCMAVDCFFSTDVDNEMLQHLDDHRSSECPPAEFLECAYCRLDGEDCSNAEALVVHISKEHGSSGYQCSVCCYRSCSPANVVVHLQHSHPENKDSPIVLSRHENVEYPMDRFDQMKFAMQKNVQKLNCPSCTTGFYAVSFMVDHIESTHGSINHNWKRYACIYCGEGHFKKEDLQIHLADEHPGELPYGCERILQPDKKLDNIKNLILTDVSIEVTVDQIQSGRKSLDGQPNFEGEDTKPAAENLVQILEETVKPLLNKVAGTTGVPPDRLYKCPIANCGGLFSIYNLWYRHMSKKHTCFAIKCPHCPMNVGSELQLASFENHFAEHRIYEFLCFWCGETFPSDRQARQHAEREHSSTEDMRIETVAIGPGFSFSILVSESSCTDRFDFLTTLKDVLHKRLRHIEEVSAQQVVKQWQVPFDDVWLEAFPAYTGKGRIYKCIFPGCSIVQPEENLFQHCRENHIFTGRTFRCSKCDLGIQECSDWDMIEEHLKMHNTNLFVCCVCKFYHFDRRKFSQHVNREHNLRDVPILRLVRSDIGTNVGISVVFAESKISFSTTTACFCCSVENIHRDTFLLHLKTTHNLKFKYFCDLCDKNFPLLNQCEKHFAEIHGTSRFKIRAEIRTNSNVLITTVMPLTFKVIGGIRFPIKQEVEEDIFILEEDDIMIAEESNTCTEEACAPSSIGKIRVKDFSDISTSKTNTPNSSATAPSPSTNAPTLSVDASSSSVSTPTVGKIKIRNFNSLSEPEKSAPSQTVCVSSSSITEMRQGVVWSSVPLITSNPAMNAPDPSIQGPCQTTNSSSQSANTISPSARAPILSAMIAQKPIPMQGPSSNSSWQFIRETCNSTSQSVYAPRLSVNATPPAINFSNQKTYASNSSINTQRPVMNPPNQSMNNTNPTIPHNASKWVTQRHTSLMTAPIPTIHSRSRALNTQNAPTYAPNQSMYTPSPSVNSTNQSTNYTSLAMNVPKSSPAVDVATWVSQLPTSLMVTRIPAINTTSPAMNTNSPSIHATSTSMNTTSINATNRFMYTPTASNNAVQLTNNAGPAMNSTNLVMQTPSSTNTPRQAAHQRTQQDMH